MIFLLSRGLWLGVSGDDKIAADNSWEIDCDSEELFEITRLRNPFQPH